MRPPAGQDIVPFRQVKKRHAGRFYMYVKPIPCVCEDLLFGGIVVTGVYGADGAGVFLLGGEDGLEEDAFAAAAGVAEGVEEADYSAESLV